MTARLPVPGSDDGNWGDILNTFLEVSLFNNGSNGSDPNNGTLNSNVVGTAQIQGSAVTTSKIASGAVTNAQLDSATQASIASIAGKYTKPGSGIPASDMATAVQTSLSAANTAIQPASTLSGGDLTGTIANPTISKIQGVTVSTPAGGTAAFLNASGTWTTPAGGGGGLSLDTTASDIQTDTTTGTAVAGNTGMAADAGHQHPLVVHDHSSANKGGNLPVSSLTTTGTASSATYLRGDGSWSTPVAGSSTLANDTDVTISSPANNQVLTYSSTSSKWVNQTPAAGLTLDSTNTDIQALGAQSAGTSSLAARADHVHPTTGLVTASTSLGGDLSGTHSNATVSKIQGTTVATPTGGATAYLNATGGWSTPAGGLTLDSTVGDIQPDTISGTALAGNTGMAADAGHQHPLVAHDHSTSAKGGNLPVSSLTTTGTASSATYLRGDGSWSTPAAGVTLDSTNTDIQALGSQSAGTSSLAARADHVHPITGLVTTSTSLGGDLSGTSTNATVSKIQGTSISVPAGGTTSFLNASGTWTTPATGATIDSTVGDIQSDTTSGTANVGSTGKAADAGHQHPLVAHDHTTTNHGGQIPVGGISATGTASSSTYLRGDGSWSTPSGGSGSPIITVNTTSFTATTTLVAGVQSEIDASSGAVTVNLPTGSSGGTMIAVEKVDSSSNAVTISGSIRGVGSSNLQLVGQHETTGFVADSTGSWWVVWGHKPLSMLDTRYDGMFAQQLPKLLVAVTGVVGGTGTSSPTLSTLYGRRFIAPCAGNVADLSLFLQSGGGSGVHATLGVYDTGDTTTGVRTLLGTSASTVITGGPTWVTCSLTSTVTVKAGQHLDIAITFDANTPVVASDSSPGNNAVELLPNNNFLICSGGVTPRTVWGYSMTYGALPTTIADASLTTVAKEFALLGRIA